jgi:hypothetical protein
MATKKKRKKKAKKKTAKKIATKPKAVVEVQPRFCPVHGKRLRSNGTCPIPGCPFHETPVPAL